MTDITKSILAINSNAQFSVDDEDINKITWLNGTTPITVDTIKAKQAELQTDYDNKKYQRDREIAYPSIQDQLDDIYHNGIDGWKATIKTTKDKYAKS